MSIPTKCRTCENLTYQLKLESEILVLKHNNQILQTENQKLIEERETLKTELRKKTTSC